MTWLQTPAGVRTTSLCHPEQECHKTALAYPVILSNATPRGGVYPRIDMAKAVILSGSAAQRRWSRRIPLTLWSALFLQSRRARREGSLDAPHPCGARLARDDRGRTSLGASERSEGVERSLPLSRARSAEWRDPSNRSLRSLPRDDSRRGAGLGLLGMTVGGERGSACSG